MTKHHDRKCTYDPREPLGLLPTPTKAIPKRTLARIIRERYESQAEAAKALDVTADMLNRWINGNRRMSNRDVIEVAHKLRVSPLALLDLPEAEAPVLKDGSPKPAPSARDKARTAHATDTRAYLARAVGEIEAGRRAPSTPLDMWEGAYYGDYRDLRQLAADMAAFYCDIWPESDLDALAQDMAARIGGQLAPTDEGR